MCALRCVQKRLSGRGNTRSVGLWQLQNPRIEEHKKTGIRNCELKTKNSRLVPILTIDNQTVEVPEGATLLQAAQAAGIYIPTMCHRKGFAPSTSCMVCVVQVEGVKSLVPACGAMATDHMRVTTDNDEIRTARQAAIELLLSDHLGDCVGPCRMACPAGMNIPLMLRLIAAGDDRAAIEVVQRDIPLPAILGRICPAPCEKVCRRGKIDQPVAICLLKRFVADRDLDSGEPFMPIVRSNRSKTVAIVGAGPCGLSAAYYLACEGIGCVVYDEHAHPGGAVRYGPIDRDVLPFEIVDREIRLLLRHPITFCSQQRIGKDVGFDQICRQHDAVLVATGDPALYDKNEFSLDTKNDKISVDRNTFATSRKGVFAAGGAIGSRRWAVRAVADGKEAARSIMMYLEGKPFVAEKSFYSRMGTLCQEEYQTLLAAADAGPRHEPSAPHAGFADTAARDEARRCLHCDCGKADHCRLRDLAAQLGARQSQWQGRRKTMRFDFAEGPIVYEPGKCIQCGLCIQTARQAGQRPGLAFVGRGFAMAVGVPFEKTLAEAIAGAGAECVANCPTGALAFDDRHGTGNPPINKEFQH